MSPCRRSSVGGGRRGFRHRPFDERAGFRFTGRGLRHRRRGRGRELSRVDLVFNPLRGVARGAEVKLRLNVARIEHWLSKGARMSDRVKFLLTSYRKQAQAA